MSKKVIIRINGKPYETYMDEEGKQRFPQKPLMRWLADRVGMNDIVEYYETGAFPLESLMQFYMDIGYTVSGFDEIFGINSGLIKSRQADIQNPEWGDDTFEYAPFKDVWSFCLRRRGAIGSNHYVEFTNGKKRSKSCRGDSNDVLLQQIFDMDDYEKAYEVCKKHDEGDYVLSLKIMKLQDA